MEKIYEKMHNNIVFFVGHETIQKATIYRGKVIASTQEQNIGFCESARLLLIEIYYIRMGSN